MAERVLDAWCFGEQAGTLTDAPDGLAFAYRQEWVAGARPPLSQSLPLEGAFEPAAARAFFGGLLPEGVPRELLARRLGISAGNDFGLLAAIGGDTAGALSFRPPGAPVPAAGAQLRWLDDDDLVALIDELPDRPMHADADGEYRLSLAGSQDKLPVVVDDAGRVGLTTGETPSTHVLKTPIARLDDTVVNEAFCPAIGRLLGIDVVTAVPRRVGSREYLLVVRYDRRSDDAGVRRLHQEDLCQALGIPAQRKYQSEGGPSLADCFGLLRHATTVPAREILKLVDAVALSFLVGNNDAHGKNHSLLYVPDASGATLAPAYDVLSTVAYNATHDLTRRMAMSIGGEYRPEYLRPRHLDRLIADAGLGAAATRRRLRGLGRAAPAAARAARAALAAEGWDAPILDRIQAIVDERASWLEDLTAPGPRDRTV